MTEVTLGASILWLGTRQELVAPPHQLKALLAAAPAAWTAGVGLMSMQIEYFISMLVNFPFYDTIVLIIFLISS